MKQIWRIFTIIASLCINHNPLWGQYLSLDQYLNEVFEYNLTLKESREEINSGNSAILEQRSKGLPQLSGSVDNNTTFSSQKGAEFRNGLGIQALLSQNIYSGGAQRYSMDIKRLNLQNYRLSNEVLKEDLTLTASSLYYELLAWESYLVIAQKYLSIIEQSFNLTSIRYSDGLTPKNELLLIETEYRAAQYSLLSAQKNEEVKRIEFNILRGAPSYQAFECSDSLEGLFYDATKDLDNRATIENRGEYKIAQTNLDIAIKNRGLNEAAFLPSINLGVGGNFDNLTLKQALSSSYITGGVYLSLKGTIFGWGQRKYRRSLDTNLINIASLKVAQQRDNIEQQIESSYITLLQSIKEVETTMKSVEIASESLELNNYSFEEGLISVIEIMTSQLAWISAYNNKISALLSCHKAVLNYKRALGDMR